MNCSICKRLLNDPKDPTTQDCGGDCLRCMAEVGEDPDCIQAMAAVTDGDVRYHFSRGQLKRILEVVAYEAAGTYWGVGVMADKVIDAYDGEDIGEGSVREYVDKSGKEVPTL